MTDSTASAAVQSPVLASTQATGPAPGLDRVVRLATTVLRVPVAWVEWTTPSQVPGTADGGPERGETWLRRRVDRAVVDGGVAVRVDDTGAEPHAGPADGADSPVRSYLGVPLRDPGGGVIGSLAVADHRPRTWTGHDVAVLTEMAESVVAEFRLRAAAGREAAARAEAEQAGSWLEFLLRASEVLNGSLDYEETLDAAAQLAVEHRIADWCGIDLIDEGLPAHRLTLVTARRDREPGAALGDQRVRTTYSLPASGGAGVAAVLASGEPRWWSSLEPEQLRALAVEDRHLALLAEAGVRSLVLVPLVARGRTLGVMSFALSGDARYESRHVGYITELGRRAALAVDNARLYRERDRVARTLQASLLPPQLPRVPHMELAARYTPMGEGNLVGGDFYDVFETGHGWVVVMGDVRGKGAAAAAVTGLARHALRAAAVPHRLPSRILRVLNEVLLADVPAATDLEPDAVERFCTVACGLLVPGRDGAVLTMASGGHPLPLLVRRDGRVEPVGRAGTLVGLFEEATFSDVQVTLDRGDRLVLYTDGVTEARHGDGQLFGEERLEALLSACAGTTTEDIATRVEQAALTYTGALLHDDLAVLVAGVPE